MNACQLKTSSVNFMLWDKVLCRYATIEEVRRFCKIENNIYGTDAEFRLQCYGRYRKLAYTGMNDKNNRPIYEGHIVKISYEIAGRKLMFIGVIGFERAGFVVTDNKGDSTLLSAYDSSEINIIGSFFENPRTMEAK